MLPITPHLEALVGVNVSHRPDGGGLSLPQQAPEAAFDLQEAKVAGVEYEGTPLEAFLQPEPPTSPFELGESSLFRQGEAQAVRDPPGNEGVLGDLGPRPSGPPASPASSKGGNAGKPPKCPPRSQSLIVNPGALNSR